MEERMNAARRDGIFGIGMFWSWWRHEKLPERWRDDPRGYDRAQMDLIKEAGGTAVPLSFAWAGVEPERGRYDFSGSDFQVEEALARGFEVTAFIGHTPDWARPPVAPGEDPLPGHRTPPDERYLDEFLAYCTAVTSRYRGKVRNYVFWNEPNGCGWINPGCSNMNSYPLYTKWLKRAYPALKRGDPDCLVGAGTLDYNAGVPEGWKYIQGIYDEGGGKYFDAIDIHPYAPRGVNWAAIRDTRRVMVENGDAHKPLWVSEYGWQDAWSPEAVRDLEEFLNEIRKDEYRFITEARYLVVTDLNEDIYGLTDIGLSKRPIFDAFRRIPKTFVPEGSANPALLAEDRHAADRTAGPAGEPDRTDAEPKIEAAKQTLEFGEELLLRADGLVRSGECGCGISWSVDGVPVSGGGSGSFWFSRKPTRRTEYEIGAETGSGAGLRRASIRVTVHPFVSNNFTVVIDRPDDEPVLRARVGDPLELTVRVLNKSSHDLEFAWSVNGTPLEDGAGAQLRFVPRPEHAGTVELCVRCVNAGQESRDCVRLAVEQ